jgi:UDP-glucose 4-epimerase
VTDLLRARNIKSVMHFAADIEVGESVVDPGKYYENNFAQSLRLLEAMHAAGVKRIVFSSTAAVYGNPIATPIEEDQTRAPINPYGRSKMMTEMAIEDFSRAYGLGYAIMRYFNVAGAAPEGDIGEDHQPESHLIPRLLAAAREKDGVAKIYGTDYPTSDGTCIRDYIHVADLAEAHILALDHILPGQGKAFNLGSEHGFSVREVVAAVERVTGGKLPVVEEARRPGDPAVLVASSRRAREELGWERKFPKLETMIEHAWRWHQHHPEGYRTQQGADASARDTRLARPGPALAPTA